MRKEEEARVDFWVGGRNKEREGSGGTIMKCFPFLLKLWINKYEKSVFHPLNSNPKK